MSKTRIFSLMMVVVVVFLGYLLTDAIASEIREAEEITQSESQVIARLIQIREAQKAYYSKYQDYAPNFDSLTSFLLRDTIYEVTQREIIKPRTVDDPKYYTRTDSIRIVYDTLDSELAIKKIYGDESIDPDQLRYIPGLEDEGKEFEMRISSVSQQGKKWAPVIQVVDRFPRDKSRYDQKPDGTKNPSVKRMYLRFGSLDDVTLSGNWE